MLQKVYPAVLHREEGYWLEFPDLPGCQTTGETIEETLQHAEEAMGLYLATLMENGQTLPTASSLASVRIRKGEEKTYVSVDVEAYHRDTKAVKKTVSIPAWQAKATEEKHLSLSKILQNAITAELGY